MVHEKRHRQNGDKVSSGEFLSGMTKEDKLIPVITLTVRFNPNKWSGPRSIHEMLATKDKESLRELIVRDRAFFSNVESEIIQLLNICVNARVKVEKGAEENDMCKAIEDMISEGREEGKTEERKYVVKKMYENGMSIADISKYTDIAISTIKGMIGEAV